MTSLGNPFQGVITITGKNFFPKSHLNTSFNSVKPFPIIPSLQVLVQFFWCPSRHWKVLQGFPGGFSSLDFCWSGSASRSDLWSPNLIPSNSFAPTDPGATLWDPSSSSVPRKRRNQHRMLLRSPGLVSRPGRTLRVRRWWWVSKGWGRPGIGSLRWDREIRERGLSGVWTLWPSCSRWDVGRVSWSGRGRRGMGSRIGQGLWWAPGWRPGKASRGGFGIPRRRVSCGSCWITRSCRKWVGKGGLGAGLRGSHVSHSGRRSRERSRRQRSVGTGAGWKGRSWAVGQREGLRSRWEWFWWICGNVRRRRNRRLRVPGALLGSL